MSYIYERFAGSNTAFLVIFVILFIVIVGGSLYLTPKVAKWIDERHKKNPGFYDGMLEEDPNAPKKAEEKEQAEDEECLK